jgi:hypothetical protein
MTPHVHMSLYISGALICEKRIPSSNNTSQFVNTEGETICLKVTAFIVQTKVYTVSIYHYYLGFGCLSRTRTLVVVRLLKHFESSRLEWYHVTRLKS